MNELAFYEWLNDPENPEKIPEELVYREDESVTNRGHVSLTEHGMVYRSGE